MASGSGGRHEDRSVEGSEEQKDGAIIRPETSSTPSTEPSSHRRPTIHDIVAAASKRRSHIRYIHRRIEQIYETITRLKSIMEIHMADLHSALTDLESNVSLLEGDELTAEQQLAQIPQLQARITDLEARITTGSESPEDLDELAALTMRIKEIDSRFKAASAAVTAGDGSGEGTGTPGSDTSAGTGAGGTALGDSAGAASNPSDPALNTEGSQAFRAT